MCAGNRRSSFGAPWLVHFHAWVMMGWVALYLAQTQNGGYLTGAAMRHVAEQIRCTPAEVEDVVSYYTMFYTRPVGKYVLNVCRTLSCAN